MLTKSPTVTVPGCKPTEPPDVPVSEPLPGVVDARYHFVSNDPTDTGRPLSVSLVCVLSSIVLPNVFSPLITALVPLNGALARSTESPTDPADVASEVGDAKLIA